MKSGTAGGRIGILGSTAIATFFAGFPARSMTAYVPSAAMTAAQAMMGFVLRVRERGRSMRSRASFGSTLGACGSSMAGSGAVGEVERSSGMVVSSLWPEAYWRVMRTTS